MARAIAPEVASSRTFARWFEAWWAADYSVAGCEKKGIAVPRAYRRRRIEFAGREWYPSHCPPFDLEGNACPDFSSLPSINFLAVLEEQRYASEMTGDYRGAFVDEILLPEISVGRLKLDQAHVMGLIQVNVHSSFEIAAKNSYISGIRHGRTASFSVRLLDSFCNGPIDLQGGPESNFICDSSKFSAPVRLAGKFALIQMSKAVFREAVDLSSVEKVSRLIAQRASYSHRVDIHPLQGIVDKIDFSKSKLMGGMMVRGIKSSHGFDISHCKIKGDLHIQATSFSRLDLTHVSAGNVKITAFSDGQLISNNAKCGTLAIEGGKPAEIQCETVEVTGFLTIDNVQVAGRIILNGARVGGKLGVRDSDVSLGVHAKSLFVGALASFRGTGFGQSNNFVSAIFEDGVDFGSRSEFVGSVRPPQSDLGAVDFRSTVFRSKQRSSAADFSGRSFRGKADFQHATFDGVAYFEREAFKEDVTFRLAKFAHPKPTMGSFRLKRSFPFYEGIPVTSRQNHNEAAHLYERAFSNLKDCMKDAGSSRFEKKFHIYELRARRARSDSEVGYSERIFSYAYDVFSQYGESISRPLVWLAVMPSLFAVFYFLLGGSLNLEDIWGAMEFSLQQIFRPFYVWGQPVGVDVTKPEYNNWQYRDLFDASGTYWNPWGRSVLIKSIAVVESILAITLSFLLALSIKRRFQVQ